MIGNSSGENVLVELPNGSLVGMEVSATGMQDVGDISTSFKFESIATAIEGIAEAVVQSVSKISPTKTSIKFGIEAQVEQGALAAVIVKGSSKANLEITLEWEKGKENSA